MSVVPMPVPYDARWPALFDTERIRLKAVWRDWLVGGIHQVGSTAVPGMPAKPVIDMVAGVQDLSDADPAEPALMGLGYERAVHRVDAVLFNRTAGGVQTHSRGPRPGETLRKPVEWRRAPRRERRRSSGAAKSQ